MIGSDGRPREYPPEIHAIVFDTTRYWDKGFLEEHGITKIEEVYLYDKNEVTYCCEVTPSYWLRWVDANATTIHDDDAYDRDWDAERKRDRANELVREGAMLSAHDEGWGIYVHCHEIDRVKRQEKWLDIEECKDDWSVKEYLGGEIDYDRLFDHAIEQYNANPIY